MDSQVDQSLVNFQSKFDQAEEYPLNLIQSDEFRHKLQSYKDTLHRVDREKRLFHRVQRQLWVWDPDCRDHASNAQADSLRPVNTQSDVQAILDPASQDPWCRYFFLRTPNSRQPLSCTREQLCLILTYYQVFPSLLDAIFTFRKREDPCMRSLFNHQTRLGEAHPRVCIPSLGRSGYRIQHYIMLVGTEWSKAGDTPKWVMRPAAAYYSLDVVENRSLWLIVKGNNLIMERIREEAGSRLEGASESTSASFTASLTTHLILFDWCAENWTAYIDIVEEQIGDAADMSKGGPVTELTTEDAIAKALSRGSTFHSNFAKSPRNTGLSQHLESTASGPKPGILRRALAGILGSPVPQNSPTSPNMPGELDGNETDGSESADVGKVYGFKQLQKLYGHGDGLRNALSVMGQNREVLEEFIQYLQDLVSSPDFTSHVKLGKDDKIKIEKHIAKVQNLQKDFRKLCFRVEKLQQTLETHIDLYKEILQYKNMQLGEYFAKMGQASAKHAEQSADRMEDWTIKMHEITEKTKQHGVSMHVITVWTLIFLPGTFVATFFSSGVIEFDKSDAGIGSWETRWGALKLFGLVCGPIMLITLTCWSAIYWWLKRRARLAKLGSPSSARQGTPQDEKTMQGLGIV